MPLVNETRSGRSPEKRKKLLPLRAGQVVPKFNPYEVLNGSRLRPLQSMKPEKKPLKKVEKTSAPKPTPAKAPSKSVSRPAAAAKKPKTPAAPKAAKKPAPLKVPSILLEGDTAPAPKASGPGARYALAPTPPEKPSPASESPDLPEAYGTKKLLLTARDPHWLYASWDLTREQLKALNSASKHGHLVLRIHKNKLSATPLTEIHVHPESRNWFVHGGQGETRYLAELGLYTGDDKWISVSTSKSALTPPDSLSEDTTVNFATLPSKISFQQIMAAVKEVVDDNMPLVEAFQRLSGGAPVSAASANGPASPSPEKPKAAPKWTAEQAKRLESMITMDALRRVWVGSLEITELIQRKILRDASSVQAAEFSKGIASSLAQSSLSSPFGGGGAQKGKGFWFNINAELIVYGATEPDAKVTISGKEIRLRPDGTFSYRFSLPDGDYNLAAKAVAAAGDDSREADLKFSRNTEYKGAVGAHPQDPSLKEPKAENVS